MLKSGMWVLVDGGQNKVKCWREAVSTVYLRQLRSRLSTEVREGQNAG